VENYVENMKTNILTPLDKFRQYILLFLSTKMFLTWENSRFNILHRRFSCFDAFPEFEENKHKKV